MFRRNLIAAVVGLVLAVGPVSAGAALIIFDNDAAGSYTNPFVSVDSSLVQFSEVGAASTGSIFVSSALSTGLGGGGEDEILMEFLTPVTSLSFDIGHPSGVGGDGWLRVFDGATQITEVRIALDSDNLLNQVIAYTGTAITSARYAQVGTGSTSLGPGAELIDNVSVQFVPLPAAAWMFLTALGGLGLAGWRRRRATA